VNRLSQKRLVDKMIDAYVDWREACRSVNAAYRCWGSASGPSATLAFGWYYMALDREERAAEVYARLVRRVGQGAPTPARLVEDPTAASRKAR
jgi:hypothetical protein